MQYGNAEKDIKQYKEEEGLNRTMQYGNGYEVHGAPEKDEFKSYYVVWKQKYKISERYSVLV